MGAPGRRRTLPEIVREACGVDDIRVETQPGRQLASDLRDLEGLNPQLIAKLADANVHTRDELADLAVDELTDITGQSAEEARTLIMKAREHWFTGAAATHE